MADVTFGRNTPTPYDARMDRLRAQPAVVSPTRKATPGTPGRRIGGVGGLLGTLSAASVLPPLILEGADTWMGFRQAPQGKLFTDRAREALSAPSRWLNSVLGGKNPLSSNSGGGVRLEQYNPPGFDPSKPVTSADILQSAQAVSRYFPQPNTGNSEAAERAYQTEKSRVAQLTAQDPELQRYENARKAAVAAGPGSAAEQSAEDIGMQMWAKKNPKLAAKLKPGQSGYDAIQRMQGAGQMGSPLNLPFDTSSPLGTAPPAPTASYDAGNVAQGIGLSPVPRNAFAGASASPYAAFSQGPTLQSAPLGMPSEMPSASYEGVTGIQPMGSAVDKFDPKGAEAQKLLEMYKNAIFSSQK